MNRFIEVTKLFFRHSFVDENKFDFHKGLLFDESF